ncbi:cyclin-like protein [Pilaira anomala]|nr:cyclin-like protein [Pilaira anomala]
MNTQRENGRRALEGGENAHQPLKSFSSTLKKTNLNTVLPLTDKNRNALKDFSNQKGGLHYKSLAPATIQKHTVFVDKEIKLQMDKTEDTQLPLEQQYQQPQPHQHQQYQQQHQQQQHQEHQQHQNQKHQHQEQELELEIAPELNLIAQDFFEDNQTRYPEEEEETEFDMIVPILPIIVPKHLRHLYVDKVTNTSSSVNIGSKRSRPEKEEENEAVPDKMQKYRHTELFRPDAPALQLNITKETEELEKQEEMRAKLSMLQTTKILQEHQGNDPMLVAEYAGEIFGHFFDMETKLMANPDYAHKLQHEITWKMRGVLIDWVVEIHYLFQLLPETLYLTVNIIDRFLSLRMVALSKLQLVGITALFIATKFEEMACPNIQDFLFMTDNAVKEDQLIRAERFILQVLDFHLCYPNPVNFLRRVCRKELKCTDHTRILAKYFMEISCIDHRFIGIRPSKIAAASLWLSKKMLGNSKWNSSFSKLAGYTPEELKPTVEAMLNYLAEPVAHDAFFKKWASHKLSKASIFVRDWINRYYVRE